MPSQRKPSKPPPPSNEPPLFSSKPPPLPSRRSLASPLSLQEYATRLLRLRRPQPWPPLLPPPQLPAVSTTGRSSDLDFIRRQQLKAIQVPILEGKLDLQLVAGFIRKVELMATNQGIAPHNATEYSDRTIQMAVGRFSAPVMTWFREVVLRDEHGETYEHCVKAGFPFSWTDLCRMLRNRYSPANTDEALW